MSGASNQAQQIATRIAARPLLYWFWRLTAVVSLATGTILWPEGWPIGALATPPGALLFVGVMAHYLQKAIFGIPFFALRSLYYDFVVALSALVLTIAIEVVMR